MCHSVKEVLDPETVPGTAAEVLAVSNFLRLSELTEFPLFLHVSVCFLLFPAMFPEFPMQTFEAF